MSTFMLHHRHTPEECAAVFAAWNGFRSPLRSTATVSTCPYGGHEIWWIVTCDNATAAAGLLPRYVGERTTAVRVAEISVP